MGHQLREEIRSRALSAYALSKASGVDRAVISRFLSEQRGLNLDTADQLVRVLGMKLVQVEKRPRAKAQRPLGLLMDAPIGSDDPDDQVEGLGRDPDQS